MVLLCDKIIQPIFTKLREGTDAKQCFLVSCFFLASSFAFGFKNIVKKITAYVLNSRICRILTYFN